MKINTEFSTIYISSEIDKILTEIFKELESQKVFILVDENTKQYCFPIIENIDKIKNAVLIEIKSGEYHKSIQSVEYVWKVLSEKGADRTSLLINLGGGIIGDLGGFAASTFKRWD